MSSFERTEEPRPPEKTTTERGRRPVISEKYTPPDSWIPLFSSRMPAARLLVIPAAGAGSRLGGDTPKVLVPVAGRAMIDHLLVIYRAWISSAVIVAHPSFAG